MSEPHPNKVRFFGVLGYVDRPSDRPPGGARGRLVLLSKEAAEQALPTLIGMGINFAADWKNHDPRRIAGIITEAVLIDDKIAVEGYVFALAFPDLIRELKRRPDVMGMSYELHNAHVSDMRKKIWEITRLTFTGACITLRDKCAYGETCFEIAGLA